MNYKKLYTLPLLLSVLSTFSFAIEDPTDLKTWSIKENSVKIAFKDNIDDDDGYSIWVYEGNNSGVVANGNVKGDSSGTGKYLIGKVSGLRPGTEYSAVAVGYGIFRDMENETYPITSEPIYFKTKGENPSYNYGNPASNLKAWRIKEHSVKISFKDHTYFEESFKIIIRDKDGKEVSSREVKASPLDEVGKTFIGKVSGLKAGTDYTAEVSTYVDVDEDFIGDKMNTSKKISFRTKGDNTQHPSSKVGATDLRTWGIRSTTAMISFRNNDINNIGDFEFINKDTQEPMTLNSKGIIDVPNNKNYRIGKMIDLTPETTYHVQILHKTDSGTPMKASKVITFTTKK